MLRVVPFKSAARAQEYYTESLVKEDYYSQKHQTPGMWEGKTTTMLKLEGEVTSEQFKALSENKHPVTGEKITLRNRDDRLIGYDFNFGASKSVSLMAAFGDSRIIDVFKHSVSQMMQAVERDAETRIRKGGIHSQRTTGNLAWSTFIHHTTRPVNGTPDCHLHSHSFAQNLTKDSTENCFKACKFRISKQRAPYYESIGRSHLAYGLRQLGYDIRKVGKSFEIVGIPRSLIRKFSRRTQEIEQIIEEKGIKNPKIKDLIGATSRKSKGSGMSAEQTLAEWKARLTPEEKKIIADVLKNRGKHKLQGPSPQQAVDYALEHCFTNQSVIKTRELFREAVAFGYGYVLPHEIVHELRQRPLIKGRYRGDEYCTSLPVLNEERLMIAYARHSKGRHARFYNQPYQIQRHYLSEEQRVAVLIILYSRDRIMAISGGAGVGKTTAVKEIIEGIEKTGQRVHCFAPTANTAYETLGKEEGFKGAKTLESLLRSKKLQQHVRGQVV